MKYLLDTHALLWALEDPENLPGHVSQIIHDPSSTLLLSVATPWELAIKTNAGKLDARSLIDQFDGLTGFELLETRVSDVIRSGFLPLLHRDPFDRLLAAQALSFGVILLSKDEIFDRYGVERIWN